MDHPAFCEDFNLPDQAVRQKRLEVLAERRMIMPAFAGGAPEVSCGEAQVRRYAIRQYAGPASLRHRQP